MDKKRTGQATPCDTCEAVVPDGVWMCEGCKHYIPDNTRRADCGTTIDKRLATTTRFAPGMYFCNGECADGFLQANS